MERSWHHLHDRPAGLRTGSLSIWEAIGISIALMAPSMAANINPQGTVGLVGRAVPLAFVIATVGVLLVSYGIVRLCQHYNHAGSVFGFVGVTLGPRSGVLAGWALIGTYMFYACVTAAAAGIFGSDFLDRIGVWNNPPAWSQFMIAFIALAGAYALGTFPARSATRLLLSLEGLTVLLILVVAVVVLAKVIGGSTPVEPGLHAQGVRSRPAASRCSDIFKGSVFGFLSFAGFEAAATLGEETKDPRRSIPRAILGTAIFGGVYFVFVTAVEMMGFGTNAAGVAAFGSSGSLLGDLGSTYVTSSIGDIITAGTALSAFGCVIACIVGATRILFALSRDGLGTPALGVVHERTGTPVRALTVVTAIVAVTILAYRVLFTHEPVQRVRVVGRRRDADPARRLHPRDARRDEAALVQRSRQGAGVADRRADPRAGRAARDDLLQRRLRRAPRRAAGSTTAPASGCSRASCSSSRCRASPGGSASGSRPTTAWSTGDDAHGYVAQPAGGR